MVNSAKRKDKAEKNSLSLPDWKKLWLDPRRLALAMASGALLGLACPGYEQWYLAWFGLAPLFLLIAGEKSKWLRAQVGFVFGLAYNLTYLHWYLSLAPLDWLGFSGIMGNFLASFAWIFVASMQAYGFAFFAVILGLVPTTGAFLLKKTGKDWRWPVIIVAPLLWVLIVNRVANAPDLLGVPWTQLEYTQYRQSALIQAASLFGGIGVSLIIVAVNVCLASLVATVGDTFKKNIFGKNLAAPSSEAAYYNCLAMALIVAVFVAAGMWQKSEAQKMERQKVLTTIPVAIIQAGINIDMQKGEHTYSLEDLTAIYDKLLAKCSNQLCLMTEGALPTYLQEQPSTKLWLSQEARQRNLNIVVGSMDKDGGGRPYNAAYGVTSGGTIFTPVYHKRYLVPFGEYTPLFFEYAPEWVKRWTNTPAGGGFASGKEALSYQFNLQTSDKKRTIGGKVAPLICFECISPEQTARSCRDGGELLLNVSDLAWFHKSDCGLQMVAFSVLRAVENRRYFVFGANTGPAAIIDTTGRITKYRAQGEESVVQGSVALNSKKTFFTNWYR